MYIDESIRTIIKELALPEGVVVVDIGCGSGALTVALAQAVGPSGTVYAIDRNPLCIERLARICKQAGITQCQALVADATKPLPINPASADVVCLVNTLISTDAPSAMLEESWRALKVGGSLVVIDLHSASPLLGQSAREVLTHIDTHVIPQLGAWGTVTSLAVGGQHRGFFVHKPR